MHTCRESKRVFAFRGMLGSNLDSSCFEGLATPMCQCPGHKLYCRPARGRSIFATICSPVTSHDADAACRFEARACNIYSQNAMKIVTSVLMCPALLQFEGNTLWPGHSSLHTKTSSESPTLCGLKHKCAQEVAVCLCCNWLPQRKDKFK